MLTNAVKNRNITRTTRNTDSSGLVEGQNMEIVVTYLSSLTSKYGMV